ncbi:hypothetical protein C6499_14200 [Candidatus Poribacteria bacterium]|nr:MAG: hypothetical protein C6499_14200 [Candidatus Poribacteria bacterium]
MRFKILGNTKPAINEPTPAPPEIVPIDTNPDTDVRPKPDPIAKMPVGMPLTNRLDKMNIEQARWAIVNADTWIKHLKEQGGEIYEGSDTKPKLQKKIPTERLKNIINNMGHRVNNDRNATTEQKLAGWIDILKWALPLIPDDEQHFKSIVQNSIENPSQWDFMEKPKR